jgi:hypothetical protein
LIFLITSPFSIAVGPTCLKAQTRPSPGAQTNTSAPASDHPQMKLQHRS